MDDHFSHVNRSDGIGGRGLLLLALIIVGFLGLMALISGSEAVITPDGGAVTTDPAPAASPAPTE